MPHNEIAIPVKSPNRATRSLSISSDRTSTTGYGGPLSPPLMVRPEAAFIAASAASQIVTNDHDSRADTWFDQYGIEPSGETALIAPAALKLVNLFLDQLLFGFLAIAKSTSLSALRPAVSEVLKSKLANAAINGADQELHEYLGGGEDEDLLSLHDGAGHDRNWDLELVWKRTRLRCMVYSSLGDMEEEDEDYYTEEQQLGGLSAADTQHASGVVSPAVAIFLTSVLEYTGEQVLIVAGQSAYNRLRAKLEKQDREDSQHHGDIADRVVVEEFDMERVAMDRTIGRLWRGWKKRVRTPTTSDFSRSSARESFSQALIGAGAQGDAIPEEARRISTDVVLAEYEHAASIPLPVSTHDIREIEIPGLAFQSDDEDADVESDEEDYKLSKRPVSLIFFDHDDETHEEQPTSKYPSFLSSKSRTRSHSLPSPARARYASKHETTPIEDSGSASPKANAPEISPDSVTGSGETSKDLQSVDTEVEPEFDTNPQHEESLDENEIVIPIQGTTVENESHDVPSEAQESKGLIAGALASAAAIGTAAVVGIAAAAKGEAPQTELVTEDSDLDDLVEEPQIMTSSRISYSGRNTPDNYANAGRGINRPQSVHSVRVIDVASPSSSRSGSPENVEGLPSRTNLSRSSSLRSPTHDQINRVTSPISRGVTSSPILRTGSSSSTRQMRNSMEPAILEEKEVVPLQRPGTITPVPADVAEAMQGVDLQQNFPGPEQFDQRVPELKHSKNVPLHLSQPPVPRQLRAPTSHPQDEQNLVPRPLAPPRISSIENGTAPLAPLRELHEDSGDNPDAYSSTTPSSHSRSITEQVAHDNTSLASGVVSSNNFREQNPLRSHPAVIANSSPPRLSASKEEPRRQAEHFTKPARPSNASASTSSTTSHKLKPVRTSEDSGPRKVEDKSQSFEQLIRSDQTIQYTLTPQNMRNIESPDSPRHIMTPTLVSGSFDNHRVGSRSRSSSSGKNLPIQSNSPVDHSRAGSNGTLNHQMQRSNSNTGSKHRSHAAQPRDPRVDRDSVNDFAEFIRSTGPVNGQIANTPRPILAHRGTNGTPRNASSGISKTAEIAKLPRRAESSAGRNRLQARDAIVPRGDISDLIDFVRSGPQLSKDTHRIPRTVAPFRSTMDSDQMVNAVGGKAVDASFPDRYSQATAASVDSSVNSRSALINGAQPKKNVATKKSHEFDDEDMMPKRKTRRVRDPYAIDLSDEDEDELDTYRKPKPPVIKEESLADFLKNVPPPKESTVQPIYNLDQIKNVKKKSSTQSFRSRFGRKESITALPPKPKSSYGSESRGPSSRDVPKKPTHTPIAVQYSVTPTSYEPTRNGNHAPQRDNSRIAQKSYQPRDAGYNSTSRTDDLADFLMKSDPPSQQTQPKTFQPTIHKEEGPFQRMFGRKKVH